MNDKLSSIYLVGMMGSGKSTIGKVVARTLRMPFADLDQEIENRCGVRIPVIFEFEGEEGFRKRETQMLEQLVQKPGLVLATGGGAVTQAVNRRLLQEGGIVVYLKAPVDELYRRTRRDRNRPLLATKDPKAVLQQLLQERGAFYEETADIVMETGTRSVASVARRLVDKIRHYRKTR